MDVFYYLRKRGKNKVLRIIKKNQIFNLFIVICMLPSKARRTGANLKSGI